MQTFQPTPSVTHQPAQVPPPPPPGAVRRPIAPPPPPENVWSTRIARAGARWGLRIARTVLVIGLAAIGRLIGLDSIVTVVVAALAWVATRGDQRAHRSRPRRVAGFTAVATMMVVLAATSWSYTGYLDAPGAATFSVRTSDWMRDHYMSPAVDRIEQYLYNRNGPTNGVVTSNQLPTVHGGTLGAAPTPSPTTNAPTPVPVIPKPTPAPVTSLIDHSLVGEGQWKTSSTTSSGSPATYTTFFRPDPAHTDVLAAAVWLDPASTNLVYVPGTKYPGGTGWAWGSGIPRAERNNVIAAFNSGFKFKDISGGVFTEGSTPFPLRDGEASLVIHSNGSVGIGAWGTQVRMDPSVVTVRQNLQLLVDNGRPAAGLVSSTAGEWGTRKWQLQYTNRSGIGVTNNGALIYVAGRDMSTKTLADALAQAGVLRGMELDIHASNPTFNFFTPAPGSPDLVTGTKLLPGMTSSPNRFLAPDQRDFFAVVTR